MMDKAGLEPLDLLVRDVSIEGTLGVQANDLIGGNAVLFDHNGTGE